MSEIDQVHPQLWIASIDGARNGHPDEGVSYFDAVITVCQDSIEDHIPSDTDYHFFEMADGPSCEYGGRHDYEFFAGAAARVLTHLVSGDEILVHCHVGKSRSAATSLAALAVYEDVSYQEMYRRVDEARPLINPDDLLESHAQKFIEEETGTSHAPFKTYRVDE